MNMTLNYVVESEIIITKKYFVTLEEVNSNLIHRRKFRVMTWAP